ncbi:MAG: Bax inhibitor-1/YccA family protein [Marmoricola sp.]
MQSRNPVFARSEGFNGRANAYGNQTYAGNGQAYPGYGQTDAYGTPLTHAGVDERPMTIDSVVQKTGITLGVVFVAAALTWLGTGDVTDPNALRNIGSLAGIGALGGFILSMVNSFKRVISPALVIAYAALEGVFIGALSKVLDHMVGTHTVNGVTTTTGSSGVVIMAVLGTFGAVVGTLAAYRFFNIRVGDRFRTWVIAAVWGFVAVSLFDWIFSFFGSSFGFNDPFTGIGFIASLLGLGLGVLMLILDFDFVERGVAAGLPDRESWRAAFGLTVTIIWIYIELLRIIAALREN